MRWSLLAAALVGLELAEPGGARRKVTVLEPGPDLGRSWPSCAGPRVLHLLREHGAVIHFKGSAIRASIAPMRSASELEGEPQSLPAKQVIAMGAQLTAAWRRPRRAAARRCTASATAAKWAIMTAPCSMHALFSASAESLCQAHPVLWP